MGSGYRVFTAGEVLTASNVQNYLQDQAVMVFGGTAARSSAIGTANFEEGMLTYLTDVDKLQVYTGAAFADVYPAAATNQGLTLINTTSFSAVATQSINDVFSATYDTYKILLNITATGASQIDIRMRVSGADNSTSNYQRQKLEVADTSSFPVRATNQTSSRIADIDANTFVSMDINAPFLARPTLFCNINAVRSDNTHFQSVYTGAHNVSTSFTGFTLIANTSTITGSVSVYGYNK